ncbi:MAG: winged helix-turn-helix domain-containing protein [Chloroflexi bacterium]|nr:winged helix-turn-helix domain-containing protein [Chloroflexota bacterium]
MTSDAARSLEPHPDYAGRVAEIEGRRARFSEAVVQSWLEIAARYAHLSNEDLQNHNANLRHEEERKRRERAAAIAPSQASLTGGVRRIGMPALSGAIAEAMWNAYYPKRSAAVRIYSHLRAVYNMREDYWTQEVDQDQVARRIGIRRETVNRMLKLLERDRWIESKGPPGALSRYRAVDENL